MERGGGGGGEGVYFYTGTSWPCESGTLILGCSLREWLFNLIMLETDFVLFNCKHSISITF